MTKKRAIPESTRRAVALRYGCEPGATKSDVPCHWCGAAGSITWHRLHSGKPSAWVTFSHELDHLLPEFHGGTGEPDNIVLACRSCNRSRGHRLTPSSQQAHDTLNELGVTSSRQAHDRKGREGNREGNGEKLYFPSITYLGRSAASWMALRAMFGGGQ
jgi:hypothetical protein